jgi:uncharacterized protein YyaL (SSP411 family)
VPADRLYALARAGAREARHKVSLPPSGVPAGAVDAGIRWLIQTHEVTGRRGSSKAFSLVHGWRPAFPETTGYIIGTLLARAAQTGDRELADHARVMGDWEIEIQDADGGIMEGDVSTTPRRSIVFDTGMVLHGWLDLHESLGDVRYLDAARRAGEFLVASQDSDGTWRGDVQYNAIAATYNARVAWALARLAGAAGDTRFADAARRKLDWVVSRQRPNGWFEECVFKPGMLPSTHTIAYTLRGLLESSALLDEGRYLDVATKGAEPLLEALDRRGGLAGTFDSDWRPRARYECLTGTAQVGGVWLRLYQATGDPRLRSAGLRAVEGVARHQVRGGPVAVRGALAGSSPVFGRYAPLQYPNWATKFLVDSLMLRDDLLGGDAGDCAVPGSVPRHPPVVVR